jgi:hypothetical protein
LGLSTPFWNHNLGWTQTQEQTLLEFFLIQDLSTHGGQLNFERGGDPKGITINGIGDLSKLLHPGGGVFIGILENVQMRIKKREQGAMAKLYYKTFQNSNLT